MTPLTIKLLQFFCTKNHHGYFPNMHFVSPLCCFIAYEQCDGIADVIFAVHAPATLRPSDYRREKEFVKMVARGLDIAPGRSRVGLIFVNSQQTGSGICVIKVCYINFLAGFHRFICLKRKLKTMLFSHAELTKLELLRTCASLCKLFI